MDTSPKRRLVRFGSGWLSLCIFALAVGCVTERQSTPHEPARPALAVVNGQPIYLVDFDREMHRIRVENPEGLPTTGGDEVQREALLNDLIDRRLLLQQARQHRVVIGIDEIDAAFNGLRAGWISEAFEQWLKAKNITAAALKRDLRDMLMIRRYLREHVFSRLAVTDAEIAAFVEENPERLVISEQIRVRQLLVKTRERAEKIAREIRRGLKFEDAAVQYSLSPEGKNGGDLGFFGRGDMPSFFGACFSLYPGQVSEVIESEYGYHLFQLVERRRESERAHGEVHDQVELEMRRHKERTALSRRIAELRAEADISFPQEERLVEDE